MARLAQFAQATAKLTQRHCRAFPIPPEEVLLDLHISRKTIDRLQLRNNWRFFRGRLWYMPIHTSGPFGSVLEKWFGQSKTP